MNRTAAIVLVLASVPFAAMALPTVGDVVGTNPEAATKSLAGFGCTVRDFEAEGGMIEAKCTDVATSKLVEVYIDPKTGAVIDIKHTD